MPLDNGRQSPAGPLRQRSASQGREHFTGFQLRRAARVESVFLEADHDDCHDNGPDFGRDALSRSNARYVHASRSPSLAGVVCMGGLQSIRRLNAAHNLLGGGRLETGEQTCTLSALAHNARGLGLTQQQQRDLDYVSVCSVRAYELAWREYAHKRSGSPTGGFPVLFAMDHIDVVAEHNPFYRHYFVQDFVPLAAISAVFTIPADMDRAKEILREAGAPFLADRVRPLIAPRSIRPPERRHSCPAIPDPVTSATTTRKEHHKAMLCLLNLR